MDARRRGWLGRASWFVALYVGGVVAVGLIALAFRLLVPH
jgi:hypothetical protein